MIPEYDGIKQKYGHLFDIDLETGNMTLKKGFKGRGGEIPQFTMIFVRGGEFTMGDGSDDDNPPHKVRLSSFFIGQVPVTQELYEAVMGENPSRFKGKTRPVEQVSWYDSINFCRELNNILHLPDNVSGEGKETKIDLRKNAFRLPAEAEWEYAARGGERGVKDNFRFAGSNALSEVGWFEASSDVATRPVALKFPNQLGIYDMSGNVWEWCIDWYDSDFYKKSKGQRDPCNQEEGYSRVLRGGSWDYGADYARVAFRSSGAPDYSWSSRGFRLALPF